MSSTATASATESYSFVDIERVVRRFSADLKMIANSSRTQSEQWAANMAHDVEVLCKHEHLRWVDVTLLSGSAEVKAVRYDVNRQSSQLTSSRPGDVMWPLVWNPRLRVIISLKDSYTAAAEQALRHELNFPWTSTTEDTSHSSIKLNGGRNYASSGFGLQRQDFTQ